MRIRHNNTLKFLFFFNDTYKYDFYYAPGNVCMVSVTLKMSDKTVSNFEKKKISQNVYFVNINYIIYIRNRKFEVYLYFVNNNNNNSYLYVCTILLDDTNMSSHHIIIIVFLWVSNIVFSSDCNTYL